MSNNFLKIFLQIILFACINLYGQNTRLFISPDSINSKVDSSFIININLEQVADLHSYSVVLMFDSSMLEVEEIRELDFFSGLNTLFFPSINAAQGNLKVDAAVLGAVAQSGSGELFSIKFKCIAPGNSLLNFSQSILRDKNNNDISFTEAGGEVEINNITSLKEKNDGLPQGFKLSNYPNPFNNSTLIIFTSSKIMRPVLKIYSMNGEEVYKAESKFEAAGEHNFYWNGQSNNGTKIVSGAYIASVKGDGKIYSRKLLIIK